MQLDPKTILQPDSIPEEFLRREAAEAFRKYLVGRAATLPADMSLENDSFQGLIDRETRE